MAFGGTPKPNLLKSLTKTALFQSAIPRDRSKGQIVIYQGDRLDNFYFIVSGYVRVYTISDDGEERSLLILTEGDVFPLLKDPERSDNTSLYFYSIMESARIIAVRQQDYLDYIRQDREAAWTAFRYTSEFNHILADRIEVLESKNAENKVLKLLSYLVTICGQRLGQGDYRLRLKLTQQDMADLIGHTRETTSTILMKLKKQHFIGYDDGYIVVYKKAIEFVNNN